MSSGNNEEGDQKKRSQMIDRTLEEDSKKLRRECKILLLGMRCLHETQTWVCDLGGCDVLTPHGLGSGESGKSTIVKQMKIIHQNGYSVDELALYRHTIYKNLVDCAKALIGAMRQFEVEVENPDNKALCDHVMEYSVDPDPHKALEPEVGNAIASIWQDKCIPKVFEHQNEFYLMDSAPYFFDEVARISGPDYIPTEADVLRARTKTTGIYETRFQMGQLSIQYVFPLPTECRPHSS